MKIKIVKKKIIEEGAKTTKDLPKGCTVDVTIRGTEMYINYNDPSGTIDGFLEAVSDFTINGKTIFEVSDVEATKGYGPLLYDVLLEVAHTHFDGGVSSARKLVSQKAKNIWDFYLNNRPDVKAVQMDLNKATIQKYKPVRLKQLTKSTSDDTTQFASVEYAAGMGDWKKYSTSKRADNARKNPKLARRWHEQSISKYYVKRSDKNLKALKRMKKLNIDKV